jgi:hypothetical protein
MSTGDALDPKAAALQRNQTRGSLRQFAAIDGSAVMNGVEHGGRLQRFPAMLGVVPGAIEQDEVCVQLRVEGAGRGMRERSTDEVAGDAILRLNAALTDACGGELLQFPKRQCGGFLMRLKDAPVIHRNGKNGHGLGWSAPKVEEDARRSRNCAAVSVARRSLMRCHTA